MIPRALTSTSALALAAGLAFAAPLAPAQDQPGAGVTIQPITTNVAEEIFQHLILYRGLEELGYQIATPLEAEYATMHIALGQGDADFTGVHWDQLHTEFYENSGGDEALAKLGVLVADVLQGYLIDEATAEAHDITSIEQFQDPEIAALFDATGDGMADLAGCNPGWGCELVIEHHIPEYGLDGTVRHNQGAYFAIIADTISRFEAGEPIFYYTWTPLWVSGVLVPGEDVRWLEVPFTSLPGDEDAAEADTSAMGINLGFAVDDIMVLANREFAEENPAAAAFLEAAEIPIDDVSAQNLLMQEGEDSTADIERHVDEWIAANQEAFDSWVQEGRDAGG